MGVECRVATDERAREAVQRLRYEVYVEELGRYGAAADHVHRRFEEPEDAHSWLFYAADGDQVVATTRLTWGGMGFSSRQVDQYELGTWLAELPPEVLAVGERAAVRTSHRATGVVEELLAFSSPVLADHGVRAVFGCCEPHLLSLYISMGQRPYASRNINSQEAGYLIPLVAFLPDVEALRGASPERGPTELPACAERAVAGGGAVLSSSLVSSAEYWGSIRGLLEELNAGRIDAFDGLTDDEAERCTARSNVIDYGAGDRVLKRGGSARNMFVVLTGALEARDDENLVGVLGPGDVFGEMAFLLDRPRQFDVHAVADGQMLSLSERALRRMITEDPTVAAKLLLNVAKMLCARLIRAERPGSPAP